jgi:hypothetical protein
MAERVQSGQHTNDTLLPQTHKYLLSFNLPRQHPHALARVALPALGKPSGNIINWSSSLACDIPHHTGASLQHCTSIIFPRLARYWPSLPGSTFTDSTGRHLGSKTSSPSIFHSDHYSLDWRGNGRASQGLSALVDSIGRHSGSKTSSFPPTGEVLAEPLGSSSSSTSPLARHWPSLRDDHLRQPRSSSSLSHWRGNGRAFGRLPFFDNLLDFPVGEVLAEPSGWTPSTTPLCIFTLFRLPRW